MSIKHQTLETRHLLGIKNLSKSDIETLLERAAFYADQNHKLDFDCSFRKLVAANLFLEASTRTKLSFEVAAHRLGIKPLNFDAGSSSLKKNESFLDTLLTVAAMKPDLMIIRQSEEGFLEKATGLIDIPLINAGDGSGEHPTQALLDALTMIRAKGTLEGLNVTICGDIAHSRVAKSNFHLLAKMGANVTASGPQSFMPDDLPKGVKRTTKFEEALKGADVVMMLRVQLERMENPPALTDYFESYGLSAEKLALAKTDAIVMHPGPMNRGVEIANGVADNTERSVILNQVTNGVAVRMAVLDLLSASLRDSQ
ncbi:MAG: aspartate carbamoyltransferase catalytic subunit [Sphingomonadales bacterium]